MCSSQRGTDSFITRFLSRLIERGHAEEDLSPLFSQAEQNARAYLLQTPAGHNAISIKNQRALSPFGVPSR